MKQLLTLIFIGLLLAPFAAGELIVNKYTNDFALSSPNNEQLKLCSCETRVDTLIVENTGQFYSTYDIIVESDYPRKIRLSQSQVTLAPKHFAEVLVYIEDSCGVVGTFDYLVTAVNSYGRIEQLHRSIRADVCEQATLEVEPDRRSVGLCEPAVFTTKVTNVGTFADSFTLDFGQFDDVASEPEEMYLRPGESYEQDIAFTLSCTQYGSFDVPFTLFSSKFGFTAQVVRGIDVANEYDFGIAMDTRQSACAGTTSYVPVTISNPAKVQDTVKLRLDAPGFVAFDNGERELTLDLPAGSEQTIQLALSPDRSRLGDFSVTLTGSDAYGGVMKTRETDIAVESCYEPQAEIRLAPDVPLIGVDVDCCGPKTYYVNVQNNADREQAFQLVLDGPSFFVLDALTVRLAPSENINVPIRANLPCTDEVYGAAVLVYPVGHPEINVTASLGVDSWSERACYQIQIDDDEVTVRENMQVQPVLVTHKGLRAANYTIAANSTLFDIREQSIELAPGEQTAIHLTPKVNLTEQQKGRYLVFPGFVQEGLGIPYNEFVGVKLIGIGFFQRLADWFYGMCGMGWGLCGKTIFGLVLVLCVLIIVLLAIYVGLITLFRNGLSHEVLTILKTLLLSVIVLLLLSLVLLEAPARELGYERAAAGNWTVLEWYQNEQLVVNLDDYFDDPDMDNLVFSATQPQDIAVAVDGRYMTLAPDHNFAGENTMIVTAMDGKGGVADSPMFLLRVIPKKALTFVEWLHLWCSYLIVLLLIGIALILFLMVLTIRERKQDLRRDNVLVFVPEESASTAAVAGKRRPVRYFASKTGTKAHTQKSCLGLKQVPKKDLVTYKSKAAVLNAGLSLCQLCSEKAAKAVARRKKAQKAKTASTAKRATKKASRRTKSASTRKPAKKAVKKTALARRKAAKRAARRSAKKKSSSVKRTVKKSSKRRIASARTPAKKRARSPKGSAAVTAVPLRGEIVPSGTGSREKESKTVNIQINLDQK